MTTKRLEEITFDYSLCRQQVEDLRALLATRRDLSEAKDILPFFQARPHMAVLFGMLTPDRVGQPDLLGVRHLR
jgi:hypothetical protein